MATGVAGESLFVVGREGCQSTAQLFGCKHNQKTFSHRIRIHGIDDFCCLSTNKLSNLCPGRVQWRLFTLFSGVECLWEALLILNRAVQHRFGFALGITHELMVPCLIHAW